MNFAQTLRKNNEIKGKLIPIPAAKKEKLNQQINDMIKALLEKNKKRDVINHIFLIESPTPETNPKA